MRGVRTYKGMALMSAVVFLVIIAILVTLGLLLSASDSRLNIGNTRTMRVQYAAEAGIERALHYLWFGPRRAYEKLGEDPDNMMLSNYRQIYDGDHNLDEVYEQPVDNQLRSGKKEDGTADWGAPILLGASLDNDTAYHVMLRRKDEGDTSLFEIISSGAEGSSIRHLRQRFQLRGAPALEFGLLTDKIECVFCHFDVLPLEAAYEGTTMRNYLAEGNLDALEGVRRVRIGSLSNLNAGKREAADSFIAGTLYARGSTNFHKRNTSIGGAVLQEGKGMLKGGPDFLSAFNWFESLKVENCAEGCKPYGNLYINYPTQAASQVDGYLPKEFPKILEDPNGNRLIDDSEWDALARVGGTVSSDSASTPSQILTTASQAGIVMVPHGSFLDNEETVRSVSRFESATTGDPDFGKHHVVLRGTSNSPLDIDGRVYVDGDVVLSGRMTGQGLIIARGNIYIVGDVVYECGGDCDYADYEESDIPLIGVVAGGNILIGHYFSRMSEYKPSKGGVSLGSVRVFGEDGDTRFPGQDFGNYGLMSFVGDQITRLNTSEIKRLRSDANYVPRLYYMRQGEHDWIPRCSRLIGCGSSDIDRRDGNVRGRFPRYDLDGTTELGKPPRFGNKGYDKQALQKAVIFSLSPKDHWVLGAYPNLVDITPEEQFGELPEGCNDLEGYIQTEMFRLDIQDGAQVGGKTYDKAGEEPCYNYAVARERLRAMNAELTLAEMWRVYMESGGRLSIVPKNGSYARTALRFDGLLYTSNAIFFLSHPESVTKGAAIVNGSIMAADIGVLVPGDMPNVNVYSSYGPNKTRYDGSLPEEGIGFRVHHDPRTSSLIGGDGGVIQAFESQGSSFISGDEVREVTRSAGLGTWPPSLSSPPLGEP